MPKDMTKLFFFNAYRSHVAESENLEDTWMDYLIPFAYLPDVAPSDYHLFRSMQHGLSEQYFNYFEDVKNGLTGSPRKNLNFFTTEFICYPKRL